MSPPSWRSLPRQKRDLSPARLIPAREKNDPPASRFVERRGLSAFADHDGVSRPESQDQGGLVLVVDSGNSL